MQAGCKRSGDRYEYGSGVVSAAITLDETGDHYTSTATNDVLDVNGNAIGSGCATSVSTRFSTE